MERLETNRLRMMELLDPLVPQDGLHSSSLPGVKLMRVSRSVARNPVMYEPSIVIVASGRKRGYMGDLRFVYDARNYLTLTVPQPFECDTEAGPGEPFLAMAIGIDLTLLSELVLKMGAPSQDVQMDLEEPSLSATPMDEPLGDAAVRLLECMQTPVDAAILGPQIVREIVYRVLRGRRGGALHTLMQLDPTRLRVHRVLHQMHSGYARTFDVSRLASEVGMSVSALHHHFKALTGTSPLQYLKSIRLHKARMLMVQESAGAAVAAERVGYESPSQFSREFKRLFGVSPMNESERLRRLFGEAAGTHPLDTRGQRSHQPAAGAAA